MKKILIVDDSQSNIEILLDLLDSYEVLVAMDGETALEIADEYPVDLILLDIMMPGMNGYETCNKLKDSVGNPRTPIVFLTAETDEASIEKAYDAGGAEYVTKPFKPKELLLRVKTQLELQEYKNDMQRLVDKGLNEITQLNQEIIDTQKEVVFTMGAIGETRSKETGNHVKRVSEYSRLLAILVGLGEEEAEMLKIASPMHDIGKVAIPDSILNKPGSFEPDEWEVMKTHAELGHEMLKHSDRAIMKTAAIVAYEHHEKWDGTGYPRGLRGDDIHIYGRITAVADVFDALGSDRCYKKAWSLDRILNLLQEGKGKHFDPKLVELFIDNLEQFLEIRDKYVDEH